MTTTQKKKSAPADPLVAASTILINGKAFEAGERVTGVPKEEVERAFNQFRVLRKSVFDALAEGVPAPDLAAEFKGDDGEEGDAGETGGAGDNGGSGE